VRYSSFFTKRHLSFNNLLSFAALWLKNYTIKNISSEIKISKSRATELNIFCRRVSQLQLIFLNLKLKYL